MKRRLPLLFAGVLLAVSTACTGGQEGNAAEEPAPQKAGVAVDQATAARTVDVEKSLKTISNVIPIYSGAHFRDDLTRRDEVMIQNQYGRDAEVYTLATNDSYPQVYHYYTTYLAQFRSFAPPSPYPSNRQNWRTLEVQLNQAMQDPFIPGHTIAAGGRQVMLQIAETEAEPKTVIRYIVAPAPPPNAVAATGSAPPVDAPQQTQAAGPGE